MGSQAADVVGILSIPSSFKVHRSMCEGLMRLVNRALSLLPEIEAARPGCSSEIQVLCSLNAEIEKAKLVLQQCNESSKLYLVYTANAIISRCERIRKMLERSFIQIQNNVPLLLAVEISRLVDEIRSATFTLDLSEEEAGKFVRQLVHGCASESKVVENFELNVFQSALLRLHITSRKTILIEKRSLRKLFKETKDRNPKKKKVLTYFFYLFKQYGSHIVAEQAETISEKYELALNGNTKGDPEPRQSALAEDQTYPSDALSDPMLLEKIKCPLSLNIMYDPVVISSGETFERVWIQKWFDEGNDTCPKTKVKLANLSLTPNPFMKDLISRWCEEYRVYISDPSAEIKIEDVSSLDHSSMSIASLGSSINDLHLRVDLSNVSFGSSDTSFSSDPSVSKYISSLATTSMQANVCSRKKFLESIWRLAELPWPSQREFVKDFLVRVEHNDQSLYSVSQENFLNLILSFIEGAIHQGDIDAQRTVLKLFLASLKKRRYQAIHLNEKLFDQLVYLLDSSGEIQEEALAIIEVLSLQSLCRQKITASGGLASISRALSSQSWGIQGSALRILHNFSSDNDLQGLVFSLDSVVSKLIPFLKDTKFSRYALFILQDLCNIEAARISICKTNGCIASIAELLNTGNKEEQEIALSIFLMLCSQRLEYCQMVLDKGVISVLSRIYVNGSAKLKGSALELLRLLEDVNCIKDPQDFSSTTDPEPTLPGDPNDRSHKNKKSSSSMSSGLLRIFS